MHEGRDVHAVLGRGVVDLIQQADLARKLAEGRPLTVKLGVDPTKPEFHLGHAVVLRKLRQFQDLGHRVVLILGDFTATIGDPSGRNRTRPPLTIEQTRENARSYIEQAKRILSDDLATFSLRYNSEWLSGLSLREIIELSGHYTVARMLERDDFSKRLREGSPVSMHEILYPLVQAYDSVAIRADVELGGTDQLFNLLVGRDIQREFGQDPQVVMTLPLLVGLDGSEKMSKSLDNYIGLSEAPEQMFAQLMKVPDALLANYFLLLTDMEPAETAALSGDPLVAHRLLAQRVVSWLHPEADLAAAQARYQAVARGEIPSDLAAKPVAPSELSPEGQISLARLVVLAGLASSLSEARRLIEQRGIRVDGAVVDDPQGRLPFRAEMVVQRGRDRFVRMVLDSVRT